MRLFAGFKLFATHVSHGRLLGHRDPTTRRLQGVLLLLVLLVLLYLASPIAWAPTRGLSLIILRHYCTRQDDLTSSETLGTEPARRSPAPSPLIAAIPNLLAPSAQGLVILSRACG